MAGRGGRSAAAAGGVHENTAQWWEHFCQTERNLQEAMVDRHRRRLEWTLSEYEQQPRVTPGRRKTVWELLAEFEQRAPRPERR